MMEKCIEAGTIQAFLDGELAQDSASKVAGHIAVCDACALALAEAEDETVFAFTALEQEFNTLVPTNRLWTKINDSIEQSKPVSLWQTIFANFKLLFANPSIAAFASLLIVAGIFAVLWSSKTANKPEELVAKKSYNTKQEIAAPSQNVEPSIAVNDKEIKESTIVTANDSTSKKEENSYRVVKANYVNSAEDKATSRKPIIRNPPIDSPSPKTSTAEYLLGEETYLKTIATLEKTVDSRKDELLKPSARFSYEKDLAVVNDAIVTMKAQVKKNPKNEAAKQVLLSSYQNKVDLLSSVADKNDLMASLR